MEWWVAAEFKVRPLIKDKSTSRWENDGSRQLLGEPLKAIFVALC